MVDNVGRNNGFTPIGGEAPAIPFNSKPGASIVSKVLGKVEQLADNVLGKSDGKRSRTPPPIANPNPFVGFSKDQIMGNAPPPPNFNAQPMSSQLMNNMGMQPAMSNRSTGFMGKLQSIVTGDHPPPGYMAPMPQTQDRGFISDALHGMVGGGFSGMGNQISQHGNQMQQQAAYNSFANQFAQPGADPYAGPPPAYQQYANPYMNPQQFAAPPAYGAAHGGMPPPAYAPQAPAYNGYGGGMPPAYVPNPGMVPSPYSPMGGDPYAGMPGATSNQALFNQAAAQSMEGANMSAGMTAQHGNAYMSKLQAVSDTGIKEMIAAESEAIAKTYKSTGDSVKSMTS